MSDSTTNSVSFPTPDPNSDKPLPLLVAKNWEFALRFIIIDKTYHFHVHDWLAGLVDSAFADQKIRDLRRLGGLFQTYVDSIHTSSELDSMNREQKVEYVTDRLLYRITQDIRVTGKRKDTTPVLAIKDYLAKSGAFVDRVRQKQAFIIDLDSIDPDEALEALIAAYRKRGKDDKWIAARLNGKIKREKFTSALRAAVAEYLSTYHYAMATDDIYFGLWRRTAAQLKGELKLATNANLRDNQPTLALIYTGLAEEVAGQKLTDKRELTWNEARAIVREVAKIIGIQAQATSKYLNTDIATGKPLLPSTQA